MITKVEATPKKQKIRVVMKRNTTITKKNNKNLYDDDNLEDYGTICDSSLNEKPVFNTEYKGKLRKRRVLDLRDPLHLEV